MTIIRIPYIILKLGYTKNLMKDRISNPDIFGDWDEETLAEEIHNHDYYYKVKYPKYPKSGIDIERLCEWAKENRYVSDATNEEKLSIKWDGTKEHCIKKGIQRVLLRKRLTQWINKKQKYTKSGSLTKDSPIIPHISMFYKILEYGPDRYEWIFPNELVSTNVYYYNRIWDMDLSTHTRIEPTII